MKTIKKLFGWLKQPHGFWLVVIYVLTGIAIVGAILLTALGSDTAAQSVLAYSMYALAAITLGYTVYTIVYFAPKIKRKVISQAQKHEFTKRLVHNYGFRTIAFSIVSLTISVGYAVFNGVIGIISLSIWYGALACYYILLAFMRGGVLFYHKREKKNASAEETEAVKKVREIKTYRTCGSLLIVLPLALSIAILQMVASKKSFEHAGLTIYAAAAYTFYKIIMSIINFVKARKNEDMTVQAIRNINLADAMVSILALQTAMFRAFSPDASAGFANALTGAGVCALTVALGIFMLANATVKLKKLQKENDHERAKQ